jgi:hypothetical protein
MTGQVKLVTVGNRAQVQIQPILTDEEIVEHEPEDVIDVEPVEPTFKDEIQATVKAKRAEVIAAFKKWMKYWADFGADTLVLEECPHLTFTDFAIVRTWLEDEGFEFSKPRWFSKRGTIIKLA